MSTYPITTRVIIDGVEAYADVADWDTGKPVVMDGLSFDWGRSAVVDQPDQSTLSFQLRQNLRASIATPVVRTLHVGSTVVVRSVAGSRDAVVWMGEITSASLAQVTDYVVEATVSCIDTSAFLQNISIGDEPWPQQTAYTRLQRILALVKDTATGFTTSHGGVIRPIYNGDTDLPMVARDVDAQPALDMIHDIATSIGGVAWLCADNDGPVLKVEDPYDREGRRGFSINPLSGLFYHTGGFPPIYPAYPRLSAADVQRDVAYSQDPSLASSIVDVSWMLAGTDTEGEPTLDEYTVSWSDNEAVKKFGVRRLAIETGLTTEADANDLAKKWLDQLNNADWMISELPVDTAALTRPVEGYADSDRLDLVMNLLDSLTRPGHLVGVDDLPDWAPESMQAYFVEGGTYTWEDGRWKLNLTVSPNGLGHAALLSEIPREILLSEINTSMKLSDIYQATAPEPTEWANNRVFDDQLWYPWMWPNRFPAGTTIANLVSGAGNKAVVSADMNSMRMWFLGNRAPSTSSFGPQGNDYLPVKPGETWSASYQVQLANNGGTARNMRLQAVYRLASGGNSGTQYGGSNRSVPATGNHLVTGNYTAPADAVGIFFAVVGDGGQAVYNCQVWGLDAWRRQGNPDTNVVEDPVFRDAALNALRFTAVSGEVGTTKSFALNDRLWLIGSRAVDTTLPTTGFYPCGEGQSWTLSAVMRGSNAGTVYLGMYLTGSYGTVHRLVNAGTLSTTDDWFEVTIDTIPAGTTGMLPYITRVSGGTLSVRKPAVRYSRAAGSNNTPRPIPG